MKSQYKRLFTILGMILFLGVLVASFELNLLGGLTEGNVTFTGNENQTVNLSIYRYANVTSSTINLTGYPIIEECYQESANTTNQTGIDGDCGLDYSGTENFFDSWFNDGDWGTGIGCGSGCNNYINYTKPSLSTSATWRVKGSPEQNVSIPSSCYDYDADKLILKIYADPSTATWSCYNGSWISVTSNTAPIYEEAIIWNISSYPTNPYLEIGTPDGTYEWDYIVGEIEGKATGFSFDTGTAGSSFPVGISSDGEFIWVGDGIDLLVYKFYMNGTFIETFDVSGQIPSNYLSAVTTNGDYIWVTSSFDSGSSGDKVYKYYMNGTYTGTSIDIYADGLSDSPSSSNNGTHLFFSNVGADTIHTYTVAGTHITQVSVSGTNCIGWIEWEGFYYGHSYTSTDEMCVLYPNGTLKSLYTVDEYNSNEIDWFIQNETLFLLNDFYTDSVIQYSFLKSTLDSPKTTADLSSSINTALDDGACTGGTVDGSNCTIPFLFHSDNASILEHSAINITYTDAKSPEINITAINIIIGSQSVSFTSNITDDYLEACRYTVYTLAGSPDGSNENVTFNCANDTFIVSGFATFNLSITANDTSGNSATYSELFTTLSDAGSGSNGGGSSTTTIISGEQGWIMEIGGGVARYEKSMIENSKKSYFVEFENLGTSARTITLSCDDVNGSACKYVTFPEKTFTLPLVRDTRLRIPFDVTTNGETGNFVFNIVATDEIAQKGAVSMFLKIGEFGILTPFVKLSSSTKAGTPYWVFWLPLALLTAIVSGNALKKLGGIRVLISFGLAIIIPSIVILFF